MTPVERVAALVSEYAAETYPDRRKRISDFGRARIRLLAGRLDAGETLSVLVRSLVHFAVPVPRKVRNEIRELLSELKEPPWADRLRLTVKRLDGRGVRHSFELMFY